MAYELRETAKIQSRVVPVIGYNGKKTYPVTLGSS